LKYFCSIILFFLFSNLSFSQLHPVLEDDKLGYINLNGDLIIPFDYTCKMEFTQFSYRNKTIKSFNLPINAYFNEGYTSVIYRDYFWFIPLSSQYVILDTNGFTKLNTGSQTLGKFSCGLVPVEIRNKIVDVFIEYNTYYDINGSQAIFDAYDFAGTFYDDIAIVKNSDEYFYIDKKGTVLFNGYFQNADNFSEGLAAVQIEDKWGYMNEDGRYEIDSKYDFAGAFKNERGKVLLNGKYGYVNHNGDEVIKPRFFKANDFSEGLASVEHESGYWGFIDKDGEFVISPKYFSAGNFSNGLAPVDIDGKFAYINKNGEIKIPAKYDFAKDFKDGLAFVWLDDVMYYINTEGKIIWQFEIDEDLYKKK